ncbi:MAG: 2-iminoacetate synthase ThiH [Bradymonadales bacterium]|nr:2-iminoacetate synthase ThiH [Bradymonadales bacterium]
MSFVEQIPDKETVLERWRRATPETVQRVLRKASACPDDLPVLLSAAADRFLEEMAIKARRRTAMKFGKTIQLYIPLYISNECTNGCVYCGFSNRNRFARKSCTPEELEAQFILIRSMEMRHILLLTGEAPNKVPVSYLAECVELAKRYFPSVSIEVYPMTEAEYRQVVQAGAEGLALYQETYDRRVYEEVHPSGPKRDFLRRLEAVEQGARAGFRKIGLGALLGLNHYAFEMTAVATHLAYLRKRYPEVFYTLSFPRLRQAVGGYQPPHPVSDRDLVKMILASRLVYDDVGLVLSTREPARLRDNLIGLGITQLSAGSRTNPAGYLEPEREVGQFEIEDHRRSQEVVRVILQRGHDPVFKDWDRGFDTA